MTVVAPSIVQSQDLLDRFDSARLGWFHVRLLLVAGFNWIWSAFGITIIGFLLPQLRVEWSLSSSQVGLIASATLVGMMIGSVIAGLVADRIGRRKTMVVVMAYYAVITALTALAWSYAAMLVLRLLSGLAMGAVLPVASTLISEYSPARYRGRLTVLLNGFFGLGSMLAAVIGIYMVPHVNWRLPLLFTSLAILTIPVDLLFLPESLRFLLSKGKLAEAQRVADQIGSAAGLARAGTQPPAREDHRQAAASPSHPGVASIWAPVFRLRTAVLWWIWFALNFTFQGVFIWLPTILVSGGNSMARSSLITLVITLGYIPGTVIAAYLADLGSRRVSLALFMVAWGGAALLFGFSHSLAATLIWGFLVATGNGAAWGMAYPVTTELYPTHMRAAATGWASGFGRVGGILAPFIVGLLIQFGSGNPVIFALLGAVPAGSTLVLLGLSQQTTGRALEEIT